ncbi:MAG: ATP-dependent zinc protease [Halioglobus sp.]|nr:ATP-dependent zinc protease [Halioglobus sp.]
MPASNRTANVNDKQHLGWREWLALPEFGIDYIKAKIDTGARTSALHAFYLEPFTKDGKPWVRFGIHPRQGSLNEEVHCEAAVIDRRTVTDSGGHREERFVIETLVKLGERAEAVEITLTDRENMRFRMLLGRTAMRGKFVVDPGRSYLVGEKPPRKRKPG